MQPECTEFEAEDSAIVFASVLSLRHLLCTVLSMRLIAFLALLAMLLLLYFDCNRQLTRRSVVPHTDITVAAGRPAGDGAMGTLFLHNFLTYYSFVFFKNIMFAVW